MAKTSATRWGLLCGLLPWIIGCGDGRIGMGESESALTVAPLAPLALDALQAYAQRCDRAIGVTVPDFVCDNGTEVPTTHPANGLCDRPNVLNGQCDPGSRFTVLTRSDSAYVVAHCRKEGRGPGLFADIAVIQYNRVNGATCFYQALDPGDQPLSGNVKAPSRGQAAWRWRSPIATANIMCGSCHDNGPFIRSPYLNQLTGPNAIPGADDPAFNRDQPYRFVGAEFAAWKSYKVEVAGNVCNNCHRMGVNNVAAVNNRALADAESNWGTALDFGLRATASSQTAKNPHSADSPIWMIPGQTYYSQASADAAQAIHDCAKRWRELPLPSGNDCRITRFSTDGAFSLSSAPGAISIPANDSTSIQVTATWNDASAPVGPIALTVTPPPGVVPGPSNPTSVQPGESVWLGFSVPLGTAPATGRFITITGDNGLDAAGVTLPVSITACAPNPPAQACGGLSCGVADDGCGGTVSCGAKCCTADDVCEGRCGVSVSNGCGGLVKCRQCPICPKGTIDCDGICMKPSLCQ